MAGSPQYETVSISEIRTRIREAQVANADVAQRVRTRRQLFLRNRPEALDNLTGTFLPAPFDKTTLTLRSMIGEVAKAGQHYASRVAANTPKVSVEVETTNSRIAARVEETAGDQERLDMTLWEENGGRALQWVQGMHMMMGGVGYYVTEPRDAGFALPDRIYYDESDDQIAYLRKEGKITPSRIESQLTGKLTYAEHGDVWAARRKAASKARAESGRSLFTLDAYPRDQVYVWRDKDGIKAAVVIEEIPGSNASAGDDSKLAEFYARMRGESMVDAQSWGIWLDENGRIVGGMDKGGPPKENWIRPRTFTLMTFYNRVEKCVLIAGSNSVEGAEVVFRGNHGCKKNGYPHCPVIEVPMMRTGINVPGEEFTTPMEPIFALAPLINQLLTILSNIAVYNGLPRWVVELTDGSTLRSEDGEPKLVEDGPVPGLDPSEASAFPGKLKQLVIEAETILKTLEDLWARLDGLMPAPVQQGQSGSSAAAWQVRQLIQQAQESLRQSVDNHAMAVKEIIQLWHGWMRDLDVPVYFFAAPGERANRRTMRALVEFDPKDLTDSIAVLQELDTPDEATVLLQQGIELYQAGFIDLEEFYEKYAREQDVRDAVKRNLKRQIQDYIWTGALPPLPPGAQPSEIPMVKILGDGIRGGVFWQLAKISPHYADAMADQQAQQAMQQAQQGVPQPGTMQQGPQGGDVAEAAGIGVPGMGMAQTLPQQLGSNIPGGMAPPVPAGA